jgi:aryl-alcohol dehydrogenase-like predicted oxidoreductase
MIDMARPVKQVQLGRTGQSSSHLGLGFGTWPFKVTYTQFLKVLHTALESGIRHLDVSPLYSTEELLGRALTDLQAPDDIFLSTKACAYRDDIGIEYQEYSGRTVMASVRRSLKQLNVDTLDCVHIHDPLPEHLDQIYGKGGALECLQALRDQEVIDSIGMATVDLHCLESAIDCGEFDHIQFFHSYTLLNQEATEKVIPKAKAKNLSVLNNAPQAGFILATGPVPDACYNYRPASREVMAAATRIQEICNRKGVPMGTAALAYSLQCPDIDVTVVAAESPARILECLAAYRTGLAADDFEEMISAAGGPYPVSSCHEGNPWFSGPWEKIPEHME